MADQGLEGRQPVDQKIVPAIINVVSTFDLCCELDLKAIHLQDRNTDYNPQCYSFLVMRMRSPKTTALVFASGKIVCTGAKEVDQSKLAAGMYVKVIQKMGFQAKFKDFQIWNILGTCDVKFPIRLKDLAKSQRAFARVDQGQLTYRMKHPKICLYISESGKILLTGAKAKVETYTAFENIYPMLTEFRKNHQ